MVVAFELKEIDLQKLSWWIFLESSASLLSFLLLLLLFHRAFAAVGL